MEDKKPVPDRRPHLDSSSGPEPIDAGPLEREQHERVDVGPRGEPVSSKKTLGGITGEGHGTEGGGKDAKPGQGSWIPAQGSAGRGMPAQRPGVATDVPRKPGAADEAPKAPREKRRDDGM
jgi:hypothetical protein